MHPGKNLHGYNKEKKRPEIYIYAEDTWYYLWQAAEGEEPPESPAIFTDDFETGWFVGNPFSFLFLDDFEGGW